MYPSIKYPIIETAVLYYARNLDAMDRQTITFCLQFIKQGMSSVLVNFCDKYYEYHGGNETGEKGLAIRGYESAFLADLVASYLLKVNDHLFTNMEFFGIYWDDGLMITHQLWTRERLSLWLSNFQQAINTTCGSTHLQFTAALWIPNFVDTSLPPLIDNTITISNKLSIKTGPTFPFLDAELLWHEQGDLRWGVFQKPNQALKYVPRQSTHSGVTHSAITKGDFKRLTHLTTISAENGDLLLDRVYPHHASALRKASLAPKIFPSLNEIGAADEPPK
mmetsp:Transcript_40255/g.49048  ORF Transcript_40255/g.49048 Transcript_40255/m.49048 type:complete len:278 (+) Transcript_40255:153-986(+)